MPSRSPEPISSVVIDPAVLIEPAVSALPLLIGVLEQRLMCSLGRMSLIVGRPIFSESKHVFAAMPAPALSAASTPRLSRRGAVMVIAWNVVIALISPVQFRSDPRQSGQRIFVYFSRSVVQSAGHQLVVQMVDVQIPESVRGARAVPVFSEFLLLLRGRRRAKRLHMRFPRVRPPVFEALIPRRNWLSRDRRGGR